MSDSRNLDAFAPRERAGVTHDCKQKGRPKAASLQSIASAER